MYGDTVIGNPASYAATAGWRPVPAVSMTPRDALCRMQLSRLHESLVLPLARHVVFIAHEFKIQFAIERFLVRHYCKL
jgi:hypothetical protein